MNSYTTKSVILDIATNWGNTNWLAIRAIDFWYQGSKIEVVFGSLLQDAYATTYLNEWPNEYDYLPYFAFDTTKSKTGSTATRGWAANQYAVTNQRLICVFSSPITFDEIKVNNGHLSGTYVNRGAKDVKLYISSDAITDTTFNAAISNSELLFDGQFVQHVADDVADDQKIQLPLYEVTYNANGADSGEVPIDSNKYLFEDTVTVLGTGTLARTGYTFQGWNTQADGNGTTRMPDSTFTMPADNVTLYAIWASDGPEFTAKSIVLDIADNWGDFGYLGIRQIDFLLAGVKLLLTEAGGDFVGYASSEYNASYAAEKAFDTSLSKAGPASEGWMTAATNFKTDQRLIAVFTNPITFDDIRVNNYHDNGDQTDRGAKNVQIKASTDAITDTTYNAVVSNSSRIYNGAFATHTFQLDAEDEEALVTGIIFLVEYDANGAETGDTPVDSNSYAEYDTAVVQGEGSLAKRGHDFTGWNTASDGTGTAYVEANNITMTTDIKLYAIWVEDPDYGYLAKSVIFDFADNFGNTNYMGIRSIEFFWGPTRFDLTASDFAADATTDSFDNYPEFAFDTSLSKIDAATTNSWLSSSSGSQDQRLIIVFDTPIKFDMMKVNNYHHIGGYTDRGVKNTKITISDTAITDTTYDALIDIPGASSEVIFSGLFEEHVAADVIHNWTVPLIPAVLDQFGYRFRNDDGSETTATWAENQNALAALLAGSKIRVRIGVDFDSAYPEPAAFQLEYRHKPAGGVFSGWGKVK